MPTTAVTTPSDADLRMLAFMLARTLRAIRSERMARATELLMAANVLLEKLTAGAGLTPELRRACQMIETLACVGLERQTAIEQATWAARYTASLAHRFARTARR